MKFFFPDSQDQVDPGFDFMAEVGTENRVRQRDDRYAHEMLKKPAFDGLLLSKPIVDGLGSATGKYTMPQRHRLYRIGVRRFFRLDQPGWDLATLGDCGSFTYVRERYPPYSVSEVIDFYDGCGFDLGIAVDHVILGYDPSESTPALPEWRERQQLTLQLAAEFRSEHRARSCCFTALGVAQGWSPQSYARAVDELQRIGYRYIAVGGMVPLKTGQIDECLRAMSDVRLPETQLHLLGISRCDQMSQYSRYGVVSFDSTSPFRQAFKDATDNYYTADRNYLAIRVPQVEGNAKLQASIRAGRIDQRRARQLEQLCLERLRAFDTGRCSLQRVLDSLGEYSTLIGALGADLREYQALLERAPWKSCECGICSEIGIQVAVFRGTERNKRRGFHNLFVFSHKLKESLASEPAAAIA